MPDIGISVISMMYNVKTTTMWLHVPSAFLSKSCYVNTINNEGLVGLKFLDKLTKFFVKNLIFYISNGFSATIN